MPRGIAWDDLPNHLTNKKFDNTGANSIIKEKKDEKEAQERNVLTDVTAIGKRGLFGVIVSLTIFFLLHLSWSNLRCRLVVLLVQPLDLSMF